MNWYKRYVFAKGVPSYLQSLGASDEIIQFITSIPDKKQAQFYVNEFRKNPAITLQELQGLQPPEAVDPYAPQEHQLAKAGPGGMHDWTLVQLRKLRFGEKVDPGNPHFNSYYDFIRKLNELRDWYLRSEQAVYIESYTAEQAIAASDEWHAVMAGEGEGKIYAPTNSKLIAYGPTWKNKEYNGWTIQEVRGKNDLQTEGNKMDHCVGSYCEGVENEELRIFSLRDPQNKPHVTIETDYSGLTIAQIFGNSNEEPREEFKPMIKEWVENSDSSPKYHTADDPFGDLPAYADIDDRLAVLSRIGESEEEYGLQATDINMYWKDIMEIFIDEAQKGNRDNTYYGQITQVPEAMIRAALNINDFNSLHDDLEKLTDKYQEEFDRFAYDYDRGTEYPAEEDFETPEEYEKALEEAQELEQEAIDESWKEWLPGGFINDMFTTIATLREKGDIPPFKPKEQVAA